MMPRLPLFVLCVLGLTAPVQAAPLDATQIGEIFCLSRLSDDDGPLTGLLSPVLAAAIAHAQAANAAFERLNAGDKGPLGDSVPWSSFPDVAPACTAGDPQHSATASAVPVTFDFPGTADAGWTDRLVLVPVPVESSVRPVLRLDDIIYADGSTFRAALLAAIQSAAAAE